MELNIVYSQSETEKTPIRYKIVASEIKTQM